MPQLLKGRIFIALIYLGLASVSSSFIAYGVAWQTWPKMVSDRHIFTEGGWRQKGTLVSFHSSGFGASTDYFIRVDGTADRPEMSDRELMIPASLIGPLYGPDHERGSELGSRLHKGDQVAIHALNTSTPVVVNLDLYHDGIVTNLLTENLTFHRLEATAAIAEKIADRWILAGAVILPIAIALHWAWWQLRRRRGAARAS